MGKRFYLHRNGDPFMTKACVVNQRSIRSFESFLGYAGDTLRVQAREVRTPGGRHRIKTLDDLHSGCKYVVVPGNERFKKIEYDGSEIKPPRLQPVKLPQISFLQLNHRKFGNIPGRARLRGQRKKEETKTIVVFCNGLVAKPKRVQLKTDFKMYQVLEAVNDKVSQVSKNGAVFNLFTTDGRHRIIEPSELEDNGQYVAVGRELFFDRSVPYDDQGVTSQLTPRRASTKPRMFEVKPSKKYRGVAKRNTKKKSLIPDDNEANNTVLPEIASRFDNGNTTPEFIKDTEPAQEYEDSYSVRDEGLIPDHIEEPLREYAEQARRDSVQEQEMENIPLEVDVKEEVADVLGDNGVPLEEAIDNKEDGSVSGGRVSRGSSPRMDKHQAEYEGEGTSQGRDSRSEEPQKDHEVQPSVYEASGDNRVDAAEILDDKETVEDKPIDQMPAEEVADEEIEESNENRGDVEEGENSRQPEEEVQEDIKENKDTNYKDSEPTPQEENEANEVLQGR